MRACPSAWDWMECVDVALDERQEHVGSFDAGFIHTCARISYLTRVAKIELTGIASYPAEGTGTA